MLQQSETAATSRSFWRAAPTPQHLTTVKPGSCDHSMSHHSKTFPVQEWSQPVNLPKLDVGLHWPLMPPAHQVADLGQQEAQTVNYCWSCTMNGTWIFSATSEVQHSEQVAVSGLFLQAAQHRMHYNSQVWRSVGERAFSSSQYLKSAVDENQCLLSSDPSALECPLAGRSSWFSLLPSFALRLIYSGGLVTWVTELCPCSLL